MHSNSKCRQPVKYIYSSISYSALNIKYLLQYSTIHSALMPETDSEP